MIKDLASATSSPPPEFTVDSYLMRNCLEFPSHCISGERLAWTLVVVVQFATQLRVVSVDPRTERFRYPRIFFLSGFFCSGQSFDVVSHSTMNCFIFLSFLRFLFAFFRFLFAFFRFVLLLG
jgi:hypothetical protein